MSTWVRCTSCILLLVLLVAGTVLETPAQSSKVPAPPAKHAEVFGESEYRIGAEDVIEVFVMNEDELSVTAVVRPDGKITVKAVGEIVAKGKTAKELESEIQTRFLTYLDNPKVNVVVKEVNSPKISVVGEVRKPDVYPLRQKTTVLAAISSAGGFTEFAKRDKVVVLREGPTRQQRFSLDLDSMLRGKNEEVFYVEPGDTVFVP
jgi:polysaccharide export outer membrane protein